MARFDRTIPPGGEGKIALEMRTKGYQGNMQKTARVMSNDPKNPQLTITMKGKIWAPIQINPRHVHLRGTVGEKVEQVVRVQGQKEEPLMVKLASVSVADKLAVELRETDAFVRHAYLPGVMPGQRYGVRVHGPYAPERGLPRLCRHGCGVRQFASGG